jgi:hypothetical protein
MWTSRNAVVLRTTLATLNRHSSTEQQLSVGALMDGQAGPLAACIGEVTSLGARLSCA